MSQKQSMLEFHHLHVSQPLLAFRQVPHPYDDVLMLGCLITLPKTVSFPL